MIIPKTRGDIRAILARVNGGDIQGAADFAQSRWGSHVAGEVKALMLKAPVTPVTIGDLGGNLPGLPAATLIETALERSVLRVFFQLAFNVPILASSGEAQGYWVGQGRPKPLTKTALTADRLAGLKVAALEVFTAESLRALDAKAEADFERRLLRALVRLLDTTFLDPAATAVPNASPASITNGLTPIAYNGNLVDSVGNLIDAYTSDIGTAVLITDHRTGFKLGEFFEDAGARGGAVRGIPLLTTRGSPRDSSGGQITIADAAQVGVAVGELRVDRSTQATLEMDSEPDDPVSASTVLISLFQNDLAALRLEIDANWKSMASGAVAYLAGVA